MPDNITCPACGTRFLTADLRSGKKLRCLGCGHSYVSESGQAGPELSPPAPGLESTRDDRTEALAALDSEVEDAAGVLPLCPGCNRRVGWELTRCPYCREEFETDGVAPALVDQRQFRRDAEPHRAGMLAGLANTGLILAGLSLCSYGLLTFLSLPLGILSWVLAERDLSKMDAGAMDAHGRMPTEYARNSAIAAVLLSVFFLAMFGLAWLARP